MAVFTTSKIHQMIGETADIQAFVDLNSPKEIIEKIQAEEYGDEEQGFVSLFVEYTAKAVTTAPSILDEMEPKINDPMAEQVVTPEPIEQAAPAMVAPQIGGTPVVDMMNPTQKTSVVDKIRKLSRNKIFIVAVVIVLFALLSWSVFFGLQRRQAAQMREKIQTTRSAIETQMQEAQDTSFLNLQESLVMLSTAKTTVAKLKEETGGSYESDIAEIEKLIADTESSIMKRDEVTAEEFYDLSLEAKEAQGDVLGTEETSVAILDTQGKKVYVLDLEKKSLDEYVNQDLADASHVALYNDEVYVFHPMKGVMKFASQTKLNTIIEPDDEWGDIVDIELYSGNIYLLDAGKEQIYKYLVTEGGFSDKRPYLTSVVDISNAKDMIIDSAIYVAAQQDILKFISGAQEDFSPQLPVENAEFDAVYTNADIEQVYVLDKAHASVYILTKDGEYVRQLQSSVFGKATSMYVYDNTVHILSGNIIYDVPTE